MKNKTFNFIRLVLSIFIAFVYVCIKGDIQNNILSFACVCGCFVISLLLIKFKSAQFFIMLALAINVVADFFLLASFNIGNLEQNRIIIGLSLFCCVQFCFLIYTLSLNHSIASKVINLAFRVALCLIVYFIVPAYFVIGTVELIALMYFVNLFVSALFLLIHFKTEYFLFLGLLVLLISHLLIGLINGGIVIFGLTGSFVEFILKYNLAFYTYIPSLLLISFSSFFKKKKN